MHRLMKHSHMPSLVQPYGILATVGQPAQESLLTTRPACGGAYPAFDCWFAEVSRELIVKCLGMRPAMAYV